MIGSSCSAELYFVFQILSDNQIISVLADTIPAGYIVRTMSTLPDGTLRFTALIAVGAETNISSCPSGLSNTRYYEWQDGKLVNSSAKYPEFYAVLGAIMLRLASSSWEPNVGLYRNQVEVEDELLDVLKLSETLGEKAAGLRLAKGLVLQALTDGRLIDGGKISGLILEFMATMQRAYDEGKPFTTPNYVEHGLPNFYVKSH